MSEATKDMGLMKLSTSGLIIRTKTTDILKKYSPQQYLTALVKDEIKCEGLVTLKRDEPKVFISHIQKELEKIGKMTGNDDMFDGDVIVMIADSLIDIYGNYLNLPDISYAIQKGISGQYGKIYGKVTPVLILEWIKMYEQDKINSIEQIRVRESEQFKGGGPRSDGTQQFKDSIREAQNQYLKTKK